MSAKPSASRVVALFLRATTRVALFLRATTRVANLSKSSGWGGFNNRSEAPKGRIWLCRFGGLSPISQSNDAAPVSRGVWAFLWPQIEPFLASSTDDRGNTAILDEEGNVVRYRPSRYELNKQKKLRLRKFQYEGWLWTRFESARRYAAEERNGWFLVDSGVLAKLTKTLIHDEQSAGRERGYQVGGRLPYSKDIFEVFIPATGGKVVGKPDRKPDEDTSYWDSI